MHIVIHTQYYPPEMGAPQARLHELALGLKQRGFKVTVLTAMPSYPRGRIYPGYGGLMKEERVDDIQVVRTFLFPTRSTRLVPRLINYFSFLVSSLILGGWKIPRADFVMTESPPLFLGLSGYLLSRWKRARWIFNISDLWPESAAELGVISRTGWGYRSALWLEKFLYHKAWLITAQSRTILEDIQKRFSGINVYHLSNGVDTSFFAPAGNRVDGQKFQMVYAGLHGIAQGLEQILMAVSRLPQQEVEMTFVGDGPEKHRLMQLTQDLKLENVHFLEPVSKAGIPMMLNAAHAVIVPLKIQLTGAVPSKLYEAMSMQKPVILIAGSEAAGIVRDATCGMVVTPGDVDGLVDAIHYLKDHPEEAVQMGRHGRQAAIQKYDRRNIVQAFIAVLTPKPAALHEEQVLTSGV